MTEEQYTRCPSCRTVFRVTPPQLAMREGQVRCGHCRVVFDGVEQLVSLAPNADSDDNDYDDEALLGPATVTLRSPQALEPPAAVLPDTAASEGEAPAEDEAPVEDEIPADDEDAPPATIGGNSAAPKDPARRRRRYAHAAFGAAVPLLVLLLAGQAAFHFRDALAARWPALHPALARACDALGCTVGPPQEIADLAIDASDLQADPAHHGLLILTATLRNRGRLPLAYPFLELSLTDAQDQVVVRRALAPSEYAGGTADLPGGIPANGEVAVKLFIDASATAQAGYRLYLFYG